MSVARIVRDWPLLPDDALHHTELKLTRSSSMSHIDEDLQESINHNRTLRAHGLRWTLLLVRRFDVMDRLDQLGHRVALLRVRSRAEQQATPTWKEYIETLNELTELDRKEEQRWEGLIACRGREPKRLASHRADSQAHDAPNVSESALNGPEATNNDDRDRGVRPTTSTDLPASTTNKVTTSLTMDHTDEPTPSSDIVTNADAKSESTHVQSAPVDVNGCSMFKELYMVAKDDVEPGSCSPVVQSAKRDDCVQKIAPYLKLAYKAFCQAPSILILLCLWYASWHVDTATCQQFLDMDWTSPVIVLTRKDIAIWVLLELLRHFYLRY